MDFEALPRKDVMPLILRSLYESYGYKKYAMGKFETYDMYMQNKSFLKEGGIITFTDSRGRLMALKPDVTMSIIKNTAPDATEEKLFYYENVFRNDSANRECREISQIGLEYIGANGVYAESEVICLALKSLEQIDENYLLDISHIGFLTSFLSGCGFSQTDFPEVFTALERKSENALIKLCEKKGISAENSERLCSLCRCKSDCETALSLMRELGRSEEEKAACDELCEVYAVLRAFGVEKKVRIDLSAVGDADYYNGIIFNGYVSGVPRAVLAGGRYDSLMKKLGKPQNALGFALYIGELDRVLLGDAPQYDAEAVLIYDSESPEAIAAAVETLRQRHKQVCALRESNLKFAAQHTYKLIDGKITEA